MTKIEKIHYQLAFASLMVFAIGIFTSVSLSALGHILLIFPGFYFTYKKAKTSSYEKSFWFLCLLVLVILASVLFNLDIVERPLKHMSKAKYFIFGLLGFFAYKETFKNYLTDKHKKILLTTFIISTTLASLSGIIALYSGFNILKWKEACHATRACGVYGMYMTYGYGISLFCILLTGMFLRRKEIKLISTPLLSIALIVNLAGLYLSYARGGLIGYLFALPFFFFKEHKKLFVSSMVAIIVGLGSLITFNPTINEMFFKRGGSNTQRLEFFEAAYMAFRERPFLGYGYKNFEPHVKDIKERYEIGSAYMAGHAHNNYLEHLASTGIIGLVVMALFLFYWLKEMYEGDDVWSRTTFTFIISFLISGLFQYTFGDGENLFLIMGLYSLSLCLKDFEKNRVVV
ncbi:MAG: O-antigen ligase family protein [Bdellovibrionales bacterium]|nr:O-antigen ligase family protein [Bdellovibrionales bacterium]